MYYYPVGCVNKIIDFPLVAGPGFAPGSRDYEPRMITTSLPRGNESIIPQKCLYLKGIHVSIFMDRSKQI